MIEFDTALIAEWIFEWLEKRVDEYDPEYIKDELTVKNLKEKRIRKALKECSKILATSLNEFLNMKLESYLRNYKVDRVIKLLNELFPMDEVEK